jgi:hypothetical protein
MRCRAFITTQLTHYEKGTSGEVLYAYYKAWVGTLGHPAHCYAAFMRALWAKGFRPIDPFARPKLYPLSLGDALALATFLNKGPDPYKAKPGWGSTKWTKSISIFIDAKCGDTRKQAVHTSENGTLSRTLFEYYKAWCLVAGVRTVGDYRRFKRLIEEGGYPSYDYGGETYYPVTRKK